MTTTAVETLKSALNEANPNKISDALAKVDLGSMFTIAEYDTGSITAADHIHLPSPGALVVQSVRVVAAGTAATGPRIVLDSGATAAQIGSTGIYVCTVNTAGTIITFEGTVTQVVVRYIPNPAADLTASFASS